MSEFWLGAASALAVYFLYQVVLGVAVLGAEVEVDINHVAKHFVFMVLSMAAAWYIAVF